MILFRLSIQNQSTAINQHFSDQNSFNRPQNILINNKDLNSIKNDLNHIK